MMILKTVVLIPRLSCLLILLLLTFDAQALDWPQEIQAPEGTIVVYQPQPEKLLGNVLSGRAAISLETSNSDEPVFGALWFSARLDTDRDADTAILSELKVERVVWPGSKDAGEQRFTAIVENTVPNSGFEISMERLSASLATAETERKSLENLKNDPPDIVFREKLTVLVVFDTKPRFSNIENSPYERAINTPFAVARNKKTGINYLSSGVFWYQAKDPLGPWTPTNSPPDDLVKMIPASDKNAAVPTSPPEIMAVTQPTELIVTDGKPNWLALAGGELLYVQNTETPWLRELATNNMYVLLSGRWYRSKLQKGPWTFVRADELPTSFSNIPPDSDIGGLRTSIAGTEEAEEALRDAAIPQTAAINRSEATLSVEYDGQPKFESIKGTEVEYAVNTGAQVLAIAGRYYAVDNGVWFTSDVATGPWIVADSIPDDAIKKIPPSSPVYNTTYVQVYSSTPEVVYVGYTPGYMWSYPYYGVPVYGTGWYYPPYWGGIYYPRPPTWGFHVGYNPWTGWSFGVSWSNGFISAGVAWGGGYHHGGCCGGWYGGGYRGGNTIINTGDINIGNNVNIGNRANIKNRIGDTRVGVGKGATRNLYNRPENRTRIAEGTSAQRGMKNARPSQTRANNVYADRSGAVARKTDQGWESRSDQSWKPAQTAPSKTLPASRDRTVGQTNKTIPSKVSPATSSRTTRPAYSTMSQGRPQSRYSINSRDLNRSYNARQRGAARERARMAPRGGRPGRR